MELKEDLSSRAAITHGWNWKFSKRHLSLILQSSDSTTAIRLHALNKDNINDYFDMLKKVFNDADFWNNQEVDESSTPLESCPHKIVDKSSSIGY